MNPSQYQVDVHHAQNNPLLKWHPSENETAITSAPQNTETSPSGSSHAQPNSELSYHKVHSPHISNDSPAQNPRDKPWAPARIPCGPSRNDGHRGNAAAPAPARATF